MRDKLVSEIARRLAPQPVKIAAVLEINCYKKEGIDSIKAALLDGEALSTPEIKISITLVTPPSFVVSTIALLNKKKAFEAVEACIKAIDASIREKGGSCRVKTATHIIGKNNENNFEKGLLDQENNNMHPQEELEFEEDEEQ